MKKSLLIVSVVAAMAPIAVSSGTSLADPSCGPMNRCPNNQKTKGECWENGGTPVVINSDYIYCRPL